MRAGTISASVATAALLLAGQAHAAQPKDFTVLGKTVKKNVNGKVIVFDEKLYEGLDAPKVGESRFRCEFRGRTHKCVARFRLRNGSILARGKIGETRARVPGESRASTLPIRDGTRRYRNATGKLVFNAITRRLSQERFNFDR
jgi:hypothetical protein